MKEVTILLMMAIIAIITAPFAFTIALCVEIISPRKEAIFTVYAVYWCIYRYYRLLAIATYKKFT